MPLDERAFRHHISSTPFQEGVSRGQWRISGEIDWPFVVVAISAGPRKSGPEEFFLRFNLAGYPTSTPTAMPWNPETADKLEPNLRPLGVRAGHIFRTDWDEGNALYAPFDRRAVASHPDWPTKYPHNAWNTKEGLTPVLRYLHRLLNDEDYEGIPEN